MTIIEKYTKEYLHNISESGFFALIKDLTQSGVVYSSLYARLDIYYHYDALRRQKLSKSDAVKECESYFKCSMDQVYKIIREFEKDI